MSVVVGGPFFTAVSVRKALVACAQAGARVPGTPLIDECRPVGLSCLEGQICFAPESTTEINKKLKYDILQMAVGKKHSYPPTVWLPNYTVSPLFFSENMSHRFAGQEMIVDVRSIT